ncbi:hypothetical protein HMPREF2690_03005 [Corynebacterium sp. HMSC034E11]|nr:hypothetical protein HMPREF2690_03005 [Corynebacterium sp. HMSC034E11]
MSSKHVALLDMATAMNVWGDVDDVGWLSSPAKGGWFPQHNLILLAPGLHPVEELCALAHELATLLSAIRLTRMGGLHSTRSEPPIGGRHVCLSPLSNTNLRKVSMGPAQT